MRMCLPDQLSEMSSNVELVYRVLRDDLDGRADAGDVADAIAATMTRRQARRLLNKLVQTGLAETTPDPTNPRQKLFEISEEEPTDD